nr:MAG TPA: hypothetical protein [Caudoviricetes sp.]
MFVGYLLAMSKERAFFINLCYNKNKKKEKLYDCL